MSRSRKCLANTLMGIADYYETLLTRPVMVCSEFRSHVLGMIIETLSVLSIKEDLKGELIRSVTSAWKMDMVGDEITERDLVLEKLKDLKSAAVVADDLSGDLLEIHALLSLPIRREDLEEEQVANVYDTMNRVMNYLSSRSAGEPLTA